MNQQGIDYSFARPDPAAIKAAGFSFVCRYLASSSGKRVTLAEAQALKAAGLALVLVFEDYANQALNGYSQGVADAQEALGQANAIGWPADRPIYFAVDFDINDAQKPVAAQYMDGVISVLELNRVGAYGGYWWIKYCVENKLASFFWQACAWSGGQVHPATHIYQDGGSAFNGGADTDKALQADFGQSPINNNGGMMMVDKNLLNDMYFACFGRHPYNNQTGQWDDPAAQGYIGQPADVVLHQLLLSAEFASRQKSINDAIAAAAQVADLQKKIDDLTAANLKLADKLQSMQGQPATDSQAADVVVQKANPLVRFFALIWNKIRGK